MEQVFNEVEQTFIQRGRARPDHNDQAHHYKSKWARGVSPADLFIVIGGCEINNIGRIHADASQRNKNAIFPQGYEATKWFWSAKQPGTIVRYILNISVLHKPPPPEQFVNNTVSHGSEADLAALLEIKNKPISNTEAPRKATKAKTFSYDDFETVEVELEEIAPPPKLFAPRKRSCDNQSDESGSIGKRSRISRSNTRRQKALELEEVPEEVDPKNDALLTDDEDTESMSVRRSVRVWSNKIKKELVEEHIPDEIDGWKIPTDDEELENGEDALDSSFTLTPARETQRPLAPEVVEVPSERRVKSQKVGKYKSATQKAKNNGKKKRKRRIVSDSESDDEWGRQNALAIDEVIEELAPSYDQIQAAAEADDDSVLPPVMRPNNIEIISMDQIKTRLISSEEETDQEQKVRQKRISDSESDRSSPVENPLKSPSLGEDSPSEKAEVETDEKDESPKVEETEVKTEVEEKVDTKEVPEDVPKVESETTISSPEVPVESTCSPEKISEAEEVLEATKEKEELPASSEGVAERIATPTPDVASLKKKLCNRGSPKIVLERLKVEPEKLAEVAEQLTGEESKLEKSYEEQVVASIVAAGPVILSKSEEKESSEDEQKTVESPEKESEVQEDAKSEKSCPEVQEDEKVVSESESEKSESDEKSETPDDDYEEEVENEEDEAEGDDSDEKPESPKRSSTPLRQSPRTKVSPKTEQVLVRRSARERRSFRCPIKECEEKAMAKMDKMLLHVKVNHPMHYAGLITRKHSAVFKICSQVIWKYSF